MSFRFTELCYKWYEDTVLQIQSYIHRYCSYLQSWEWTVLWYLEKLTVPCISMLKQPKKIAPKPYQLQPNKNEKQKIYLQFHILLRWCVVDTQLVEATTMCRIRVSSMQLWKINVRNNNSVTKIYVRIYHVICCCGSHLHAKGDQWPQRQYRR